MQVGNILEVEKRFRFSKEKVEKIRAKLDFCAGLGEQGKRLFQEKFFNLNQFSIIEYEKAHHVLRVVRTPNGLFQQKKTYLSRDLFPEAGEYNFSLEETNFFQKSGRLQFTSRFQTHYVLDECTQLVILEKENIIELESTFAVDHPIPSRDILRKNNLNIDQLMDNFFKWEELLGLAPKRRPLPPMDLPQVEEEESYRSSDESTRGEKETKNGISLKNAVYMESDKQVKPKHTKKTVDQHFAEVYDVFQEGRYVCTVRDEEKRKEVSTLLELSMRAFQECDQLCECDSTKKSKKEYTPEEEKERKVKQREAMKQNLWRIIKQLTSQQFEKKKKASQKKSTSKASKPRKAKKEDASEAEQKAE